MFTEFSEMARKAHPKAINLFVKKPITSTAGETTEIDLRPRPRPLLPPTAFGVEVLLSSFGVEVTLGTSVTLLTAAGDTMVPAGTPLGVAPELGVWGVMRFPEGFFHVQMRYMQACFLAPLPPKRGLS